MSTITSDHLGSFPEFPASAKKLTKNVPPSVLELSADLKAMYDESINCDMRILLPDTTILCHRGILSARSKWFAPLIEDSSSYMSFKLKVNENSKIMKAVLVYMYTGNLCLLESLKVPIFDLLEATVKYGLDRLNKLLTRMLTLNRNPHIQKSCQFLWRILLKRAKSVESTYSLNEFSLDGSDKWYLKIRPFENGVNIFIAVYLQRVTTKSTLYENPIHIVNFEMRILDAGGKDLRTFSGVHILKMDSERRLTEFLPYCDITSNEEERLLSKGMLNLSFKLTVSVEDYPSQPTFEIKQEIERDVTNEMNALSRDMYKVLKYKQCWDVNIFVGEAAIFRVLHAHSYILYARTRIPTALNGKLMDLGDFTGSVWRSFLHYLYTGQTRYLENHMREIYFAVSKQQLTEMQKKYSHILACNLTISNVYDILFDAINFGDMELVQSGLSFIAKNDITDNVMWTMLTNSYPNLAREVMLQTRQKRLSKFQTSQQA